MTTEVKTSGTQSNQYIKLMVHLAVMLLITFGFRVIPAPEGVTPYGMAVAGVFLV